MWEREREMARGGHMVLADPGSVVLGSLGKKKSLTVARSWMLMDGTGEGTVLDVDKYSIMHRVHIHARDLRILDPLLSYPSTILGRDKAIVLNLEVFPLCIFWLFFFVLVLVLTFWHSTLSDVWDWCFEFLGVQHIKAIITAEEVNLSLVLFLKNILIESCRLE